MIPAYIAAIAIGWTAAGFVVALLLGRCIPPNIEDVSEIEAPRRLRHDSGHQRLERGRFSKGAVQKNHNGEIAPIRERNHG